MTRELIDRDKEKKCEQRARAKHDPDPANPVAKDGA